MIKRLLQAIFEPEVAVDVAPPKWVSYTVGEQRYDEAMQRMQAVSRLQVVR